MSWKHACSILVMLFVPLGCGGPSMPTMKMEQQQMAVKSVVFHFLSVAKTKSATAAESLDPVMETLEHYKKPDETVDQIKTICNTLRDLYARSASESEIKPKLVELEKLAQSLPGEARVDSPRAAREGD